MKDTKCVTNFLSDEPSKETEFESHGKVSRALAGVIDGQKKAGKAIVLLGPWGSGKSTIIEILKKRFVENKEQYSHENLVFIFDAWIHQGDPLRTSFLSELNEFLAKTLTKSKWSYKEEFDKEIEELNKREEKTETRTTPSLTRDGKCLAVSLFVSLVFSGLISFYSLFVCEVSKYLFIGASLIAIFLPLIIVYVVYDRNRKRPITSQEKEKDDIISLFFNQISHETTTYTIKKPEPTTIKFQDTFSKILSRAIDKERTRLTIVLDNLDRIDVLEAKSLWSTMRTFFEYPLIKKPEWLDNFWLIVPMDNTATSRLWASNEEETLEVKVDQPQGKVLISKKKDDLSKSFIDKTFQIVFRVAPPVPFDWRKYFIKYLSKAIKHDKSDLNDVYRLFQLKYTSNNAILTPREIKLFINKLAAVHCQRCGDGISLVSQALFTLHVEKITNIIENIKDKEFFGTRVWDLYIEGKKDITEEFVALYLNVEKTNALQILVEPQIDASFENAAPDTIEDIVDQPWFEDTCERIVAEKSGDWDWGKIVNAAYVIDNIRKDSSFSDIFSRLITSLRNAKSISVIDVEKAKGLSAILYRSGNERQALEENTIKLIANMVFKAENDGLQPDTAILEEWVKGVIILLGSISDKDKIANSFRVPGKAASTYLNILGILCREGDDGEALLEHFIPKNLSDSDIFNALGSIIDSRALSEKELKFIEMMLNTSAFDTWNWNLLVESLFRLFQAPSKKVLEPKEVITGLSLLNRLARKGKSVSDLSNVEGRFSGLAKDGHIFWHLSNLLKNKGSDFDYGLRAIGATIVPIVRYAENDTAIKPEMREYWEEGYRSFKRIIETFDDKPDNKQVLEYFTEFFLDFYDIDELIAKMNNIPSLIIKVSFEYINKKGNKLDYFTPEKLIEIYKIDTSNNFKNLFKEDSKESLVAALVNNSNLISVLREATDFSADLVELYILVLKTGKGSDEEDFKKFLADSLSPTTKDEWTPLLVKQPETGKTKFDLLLALLERNTKLDPSTNLYNALEDYVGSVINGNVTPNETQIERNKKIPEALQDSDRNNFVRKLSESIRDKVKVEESYSIEIPFKLYGKRMVCQEVFSDDNSEFVRVTFKHIINRQSSVEIDWLDEAADFLLHTTVKKNIREALTTFVGQIRSRLSEQNIEPAIKNKIESIYVKLEKKFGRRKPKK